MLKYFNTSHDNKFQLHTVSWCKFLTDLQSFSKQEQKPCFITAQVKWSKVKSGLSSRCYQREIWVWSRSNPPALLKDQILWPPLLVHSRVYKAYVLCTELLPECMFSVCLFPPFLLRLNPKDRDSLVCACTCSNYKSLWIFDSTN